jgi:hypothetical protein
MGPTENGLMPLIWVPRGLDHGREVDVARPWKSGNGNPLSLSVYTNAQNVRIFTGWMNRSQSLPYLFFTYHAFFFHLKACFMRLDFSRCSTSSIFTFFFFTKMNSSYFINSNFFNARRKLWLDYNIA